jgi:hypothetical protein
MPREGVQRADAVAGDLREAVQATAAKPQIVSPPRTSKRYPMGYRDTVESLKARRESLDAELREARKAASEARERAARVAALEGELAETEGLLRRVGGTRELPLLDDVRIAAPCHATWEDMAGDERVRFCGQCEKNVYNLSAMPRAEAEALLRERTGEMCVRLFKRADGTVLTQDCPVGVRRRGRRRLAMAAVGSGIMAAATAAFGASTVTMGAPQRPPAPTVDATQLPEPTKPIEPVQHVMGGISPRVTASTATPPPPPQGQHVMGRRSR